MHGAEKKIVYIIRSDWDRSKYYTGITNHLQVRLYWHNNSSRGHTLDNRPWSLVVTLEFATEKAAVQFEEYLKGGSGRAFAKRHFTD